MTSDLEQQKQELAELQNKVSALEDKVRRASPIHDQWNHDQFYGTYYGTVGFVYGGIAAMVSLMFNVVGSTLTGKHPLEIIRVYMTFPLGEKALALSTTEGTGFVIDDGMILSLGCCLYIGTGMVLGVLFHWLIGRFALKAGVIVRLLWGTGIAVVVWAVNFYGILSWLQPALFGGNWITNGEHMEWWVALATHVVFGWAMALMAPLGAFEYYKRPTETAAA